MTKSVHPICHHTLHARFSNAELARIGDDVALLRADAQIANFLGWITRKPPDFHAPTRGRR